MINFQDVLKQKNATSGALWSDEGVYAISKEIQLLKPEQFGNIFLGMGPFHMEKIVIACLGKFLSCIGIDLALIETEAFGKLVVENSVMTGGHYCKGKEAMSMVLEVMTVLMFEEFHSQQDSSQCELDMQIETMESKMQLALDVDHTELREIWEESKILHADLKNSFTEWKEAACNENVRYWSLFLDELYPILRDLTHSIRQGDWHLFISVVRRCMPLFFGFGRTNYSRWGTLFLEDCLDLQRKFPGIYRCFIDGGWVMYHTLRQGSAVGFDMALEKCYNKPAKVAGGIIGMTRQKEAVALWKLLKHEKDLHVAQLLEWCNLGDKDDSELSLHHDRFNPSSTKIGHERAKALLDYIKSINNPFSTGIRLHNISTGTDIPQEVVGGLLECLEIGENSYQEFVETRFQNKEKHLHDTIPTNRNTVFVKHPSTSSTLKKSMAKKDAAETIRYIDYARERGYSMLELLKYELTSTSQFLTTVCEVGIRLKKPDKASLSRELVNQLPQEKRNVKCDAQMTIVDFMALVRKLPIKKMGIDTFGELAESLCNSILATGSESTRIDIIFDVYQKSSIKQMERAQRSSSEQITITIRSDNQKVPVDLDMFWSSMLNKVRLQEYVFKWMLQNVVSEKEIIFGGVNGGECRKLLAGIESEITELSSNQEEADDRIMFHINDVVVKHGVQSVLVDSPDTDVFVNLIFHFHKTWQLQKLFVKLGKRKNKKTIPVHLLVDQLDNNLVSCLPAIHALSGCDSTSKVGPKLSGMKASMDLSLLEGFGVEELSPQMISNAEKFLVSGLKKTDCSTVDEYRWEQYHNAKKELDFNLLVCCSSTLGEHRKRAYLQCKMWLQAPTPAVTTPDLLQYGYKATDVGLTPVILPVPCRPDDLPPPCKCPTSCISTKTCTCRGMNIKCVVFCGCSKGKKCRNPHN